MEITEKTIPLIEKALGIKLFDKQKEYLLNNGTYWFGGRSSGKTLAYCIKLALSEGKPLDMRKNGDIPIDRDYGTRENIPRYSHWFRPFFLDIWNSLKDAELSVREVRH